MPILSFHRTIKYYTLKLMRMRGNPHALAMGTAVGVFVGVTPTIPLHSISIIGITLLMRVNTLTALIAATLVSNPLTMVPQYFLCWRIGNFILPDRLTWERIAEVVSILSDSGFVDSLKSTSQLSADAIMVMLTGGVLLALPLALLSYFISFHFFNKFRQKRHQKHLLE